MDRPVPQYLRDHAQQLAGDIKALSDTAIRQGAPAVLDLLALIASEGHGDYATLLAEMRAVVDADDLAAAPPVRLRDLARLARTVAGQARGEADLVAAADLYQAVRVLRRAGVDKPLPGDTDLLDVQTNLVVGRVDYVSRVLPALDLTDEVRWMLEAELLNPAVGSAGSFEAAWLPQFNRVFDRNGLGAVALLEGDASPFDRLAPAAHHGKADAAGPLVTIVMSVFRPDQSLFTALRSLADQTWTHLQVLVVDDCSPAEYQPMIEEAVSLDERFELHRMPENGGTYAIRNAALRLARGEFVGFQDSDDWSHPERIERQLRSLLNDPALIATLSSCLSVDPEMRLTAVGYGPFRTNASSLLMRLDPVLERLGGFDEVRKGADSEFIARLAVVFGAERVALIDLPLAIVQLTADSLSRGEFNFGWRDGNRVAYRDAFEFWHDQIVRRGLSARLVEGGPRAFPAPDAFVGRRVGARPRDVVMVSDWRAGNPRYEGATDEAVTLSRLGCTTVLAHTETMRFAQQDQTPPMRSIMLARSGGAVSVVRWEDPVTARLAVVRDPELLSYPRPADRVALRAGTVVIYAGHPPRASDQTSVVYDPVLVENNAKSLFGGEVVWQPATADIATALVAEGASGEVGEPGLLGVVPLRPRPQRGLRGGTRLVVGVTDLGTTRKDRPTWPRLLARLPDDDRYDVRVRDVVGAMDAIRTPRPAPPNWLVTTSGSLSGFLRQLDVYVDFPRRSRGPEPSYVLLAAMAGGCVLVLDPAFEAIFGDAARYLDGPVEPVLDSLCHDRAVFAAQQQRGYDFITDELSPQTYAARIDALTGTTIKEKETA